jgi:uncharacterized OB-fold protein
MIPFKEGLMHLSSSAGDESYLIGSKCKACGAVAFPKRVVCHKCLSQDMAEIPLSKKGKLASFIVSWAAPSGFTPPLIMGYIDLPEGVRFLSVITGCKPSPQALELGQEMELVIEKLRTDADGNHVMIYKYKPVSNLPGPFFE